MTLSNGAVRSIQMGNQLLGRIKKNQALFIPAFGMLIPAQLLKPRIAQQLLNGCTDLERRANIEMPWFLVVMGVA